MKIGLSWLNQIRSDVDVGGFTAETFDSLIAQLEAAYHTEHTVEDGHATITATGSISERGRSVPQGEWIERAYVSTDYTAGAGQFVVRSTNLLASAYMLVGTTLTMTWQITGAQQAVATTTQLKIALPAMPVRIVYGTFAYDDNGTRGIGVVSASPGTGGQLILQKDLAASGTFSVSTNLSLAGQISVEIDGTL